MPRKRSESHSPVEDRDLLPLTEMHERPSDVRPGVARTLLVYAAMVAVTLAIFFVIRSVGECELGPAGAAKAAAAAAETAAHAATTKPGAHILGHVLLALAAVIAWAGRWVESCVTSASHR